MDASAYSTLTPRELDCLRLVAQGLTSKEIALQLRLTDNTVTGYLKDAMRKLGTSDRRTAARFVAAQEGSSPQWLGGPSVRGGELVPEPALVLPTSEGSRAAIRLPFRRRGERVNELGIIARLLWIPVISAVLAIAFGMLSSGLKVWSDLIGSSPLLHSATKVTDGKHETSQSGAVAQRGVPARSGS